MTKIPIFDHARPTKKLAASIMPAASFVFAIEFYSVGFFFAMVWVA